jgi:hypothetical protein
MRTEYRDKPSAEGYQETLRPLDNGATSLILDHPQCPALLIPYAGMIRPYSPCLSPRCSHLWNCETIESGQCDKGSPTVFKAACRACI